MTAREFCYWLQGWFELGGGVTGSFGSEQVRMIRAHIDLVKTVDAKHSNLFVAWLDMRLRGANELDVGGTAEVQRLLGAQFKHEIDPSYGGNQQSLTAVHGGRPDAYRC